MYIVLNANMECEELNLYNPVIYDDIDSAINFCKNNIAEDFGFDNFEEFAEAYEPEIYHYDSDLLFDIRSDNGDGHKEIYRVYFVK